MESQPQISAFRKNPEDIHSCDLSADFVQIYFTYFLSHDMLLILKRTISDRKKQ